MNQGVIAARYAKALLRYVQEVETGDGTYSQVCILVQKMQTVSRLYSYVCRHPEVPAAQKIELMTAALEEPLSPALQQFTRMVYANGRMDCFQRMLYSFLDQYRQANGIKVGRLVSAVHVDGLRERIETMLCERTGADVRLEEDERPDLLGGFVLEIDGLRFDASVREQLDRMRRELIEKNSRIV